jgi:hypothetical protein
MIFLYFNSEEVFAHKEVQIGNGTLEVGWVNEPPLVGILNQVLLSVTEEDIPVRNALKDVSTSVTFGGLSKQIRFVPSEESSGVYLADIIPRKLGSYSLSINGKINNQNIQTNIEIEDVENTNKISFPLELDENDKSSENIAKQVGPLINDLSKQISDSKNEINSTKELLLDSLDKIDSLNQDVDVIYMMIYVAIAFGVAGIILSFYRMKVA